MKQTIVVLKSFMPQSLIPDAVKAVSLRNALFATFVLTLLFAGLTGRNACAGNTDPDRDGSHYVWGENAGWINTLPLDTIGVVVTGAGLTGFAWSENVGWINFNPTNAGVVNDGAGNLSGYAWGENVGWINFAGVTIDTAGFFHGRAWGENIGWISFASTGPAPFNLKTSWLAPLDAVPDAFSFSVQTSVALSSLVTTESVTIKGTNTTSLISISGGAYSVNNSAFTETAGTINPGDVIRIQLISSGNFSTLMTATLTVGGVSADFSATTLAMDTTPDAFSFPSLENISLNTIIQSNAVTVSGVNAPSSISITGGHYSINGGSFTAAPGTVSNGDAVRVQLTSSNNYLAETNATLTIGGIAGVSAGFSVKTKSGNTDPASDGSHYAWGENVGWINLLPLNVPGVVVTGAGLTGYAWGENVGWINFSPVNAGVVNDGAGNLSGYAWGENVGWINFTGVTIDSAGLFHGRAWGENIGWISLEGTGDVLFSLKTAWLPNHAPVFSNTPAISGSALVGSTVSIINTTTTDADGDTVTLSYQWRFNEGAGGSAISGATAATYVLASAAAGKIVGCLITANDGHGGTAVAVAAGISVAFPAASAPAVSGTSPTNNARPTWTWVSGGGGNGTYQYYFGDIWTTTTATAYTPANQLAEGSHLLYVQEQNAAGSWSLSGSSTIEIDTTGPALVLSALQDGAVTSNPTLNITGTTSDANSVQGFTVNAQAVTLNTADNIHYTFSYPVTLNTGTNVVTTVATDIAGNTTTDIRSIVLDQIAPNLLITTPADNSVMSRPTVTVIGSTNELSTVLISVNSGPTMTAAINGTSFSLPVILSINTMNTINLYATDQAGNTTTVKRTVTIDEINPSLAIMTPNQDYGTNQASVMVSGTASDLTNLTILASCPTASVGVVSTPTATLWSVNITNLQPGVNSITLQATDDAGNSTSVIRNIICTATPVAINAVISPTAVNHQAISGTREKNASVAVTATSGTIGTVSYPSDVAWQVELTLIAEGTTTISATATDILGNMSSPAISAILLDVTSPTTTASSAGYTFGTWTMSSSMTITLSGNDDSGSGIAAGYPKYCIDTNNSCDPDTSGTFLNVECTDGSICSKYVRYFSVDNAGNNETVKSVTVNQDCQKPSKPTVFGLSPTQSLLPTWTWTTGGGGGNGNYQYQLDSTGWHETTATSFTPGTALTSGSHTLYVQEKDDAGNWSISGSWLIEIDTIAPIVNAGLNKTKNVLFTQTATASDAHAMTYVWSKQTGTGTITFGTPAGLSTTISASQNGTYILRFTATDAVGNSAYDEMTLTWDTIAPNSPMVNGATPTNDSTPTWTWSTGGGGSGYRYKLDLNSWVTTTATTYTPATALTSGSHTLLVQEKDAAGNWSLSGSSIIQIDLVGPTLSLSMLPDGAVTRNWVLNITGSVLDPNGVSTISINVNSEPTATVPANFNIATQLKSGDNTIVVMATDSFGNETTETRTITYDATAPKLTVIAPSDNSTSAGSFIDIVGTNELDTTVTVYVNNGAAHAALVSGQSFTASALSLTPGINTIEVIATNATGSTNSIKRTVLYDSLGATLNITQPAEDSVIMKNSLILTGTVPNATGNETISILAHGQTYTALLTNGTFTKTVTFPTEGDYSIMVTLRDNSGNTKSTVQRNIIYYTIVSPTMLNFGNQLVSFSSTTRTVIVHNTGEAPLIITSMNLTGTNLGQFAKTSTCRINGTGLASGATCTINVLFKPTTAGAKTASLAINVADPATSQLVTLSGIGVAPIATFMPATLPSFGNQLITTASTVKTVQITNTGTAPLFLSTSLTGSNPGQFSQVNTCSTGTRGLATGATCTISVTFKPTVIGEKNASLQVTASAPALSRTIALTGMGTAPIATVTPTVLSFGTITNKTTSPAKAVKVTNTGTAPLFLSTSITGTNPAQFAQVSTCPTGTASLATGATCTINVTFKPTAIGLKSASLSIDVAAPAVSKKVMLSGTGK